MTYQLPDPKNEKDWYRCVILSFKTLKGVSFDNQDWDKANFARCVRSAKLLLALCGGLRQADACMVELSQGFEEKGLTWTLETITRHASDWVQKKRGGANAKLSRKRFFDALAQSSSETKGERPGELTSSGQILDGLRNLPAPESRETGTGDGGKTGRDGGMLHPVDQESVEDELRF